VLAEPSRAERRLLSVEHGVTRHYRIRELLSDGAVHRTFWFSDRGDADAFLWAAISGSLQYERELWRLPVPCWEPSWPDVTYDFVTNVSITSTSGSNQNYTVPSDWNPANNSIQAVGSGGSGAVTNGIGSAAGGGGGGGWGQVTNAGLTPGGSAAFFLNVGGVGPVTSLSANGSAGSPTWMRTDGGTTAPGTAAQGVLGATGGGATNGSGTVGGGVAGTANVGSSTNNGGSGGAAIGSAACASGGGGGAGGPSGAGGSPAAPTDTWAAGGNGDNNFGGGGGAVQGGNGSPGGEIDGIGVTGSGGGGAGLIASGTAGSGGNAGGGGGGATYTTSSTNRAGSGGNGLIVLKYTPSIPIGFNMPMQGL
jgi:hypothetical protein